MVRREILCHVAAAAIVPVLLLPGPRSSHVLAHVGRPVEEAVGFSPLFERRLVVGIQRMDAPAERVRVAELPRYYSDTVGTPASGNPLSGCLGSACLGSVCLGSLCMGSKCLGSACISSGCLGSGCTGSGCAGSACIESGCVGSACIRSGCLGSACLSCGQSGIEGEEREG